MERQLKDPTTNQTIETMESFWKKNRETTKSVAIGTKTKVLQHPRKMDIDDYFAMNSLLGCNDLEQEEVIFLKTQSKRKHRVVRSLGETLNFSAGGFIDDSYKDIVNASAHTTVKNQEESNYLLCGNTDEEDNTNDVIADSHEESKSIKTNLEEKSHHFFPAAPIFDARTKEKVAFLPPLASGGYPRCGHDNNNIINTSKKKNTGTTTSLKCEPKHCQEEAVVLASTRKLTEEKENTPFEIKVTPIAAAVAGAYPPTAGDVDAGVENPLLDLEQDFSDVSHKSNYEVPSSFSPVDVSSSSSRSAKQKEEQEGDEGGLREDMDADAQQHEEEDMQKASSTSSSFFLRPNKSSMITTITTSSTIISQMLWRGGNTAAQKYLQISHFSPDGRAEKSLWTLS